MNNNLPYQNSSSGGVFTRFTLLIKKIWSIRIFRFFLIGGLNTVFGFMVYSLLIILNLHYALASLCSTIIGIIFNFFTTGYIVFSNKNFSLIFRFIGVYGVVYLINLGFLKFFHYLQFNMVWAGAILLIPMAIISYFLNRQFVFIDKRNHNIR